MKTQFLTGVLMLLCICFCQNHLVAQESGGDNTLFNAKSIRFTGAWGGTNHYAGFFGDNTKIGHGAYGMVEFSKDYLLGWGTFSSDVLSKDGKSVSLVANELILGYTYKSYNSFHPLLMLQAGSAKYSIQDGPTTINDNVFIVSPILGMEVNALRWVRIALEGGYRLAIGSESINGFSDSDFSGPFIGLRFKLGWSWG